MTTTDGGPTVGTELPSTRIDGVPVAAGHPAFEELTRPWNLASASRPTAVVRPATAPELARVVARAGAEGTPVAVQCTGHGAGTDLSGTLLVSTAGLTGLEVHPDGWARVEAGVRWADVITAAAEHGRAPLCGSAPGVGAVGLLTGGGLSPMVRPFGWCSDRVRALEVVTGDGVLRRADRDSEPDLFWGLRGGKDALGLVTAVELELLPLDRFFGGAVFFDGADLPVVLETWRTWTGDLPDAATTSIALCQLPPMPGVPEPLAGRFTVAVRFSWVGDPAIGEEVLAPIRQAAPALLDSVEERPWTQVGLIHSDPADPLPAHEDHALLHELDADAVRAVVDAAGPDASSPQVIVELRHFGDGLARSDHDSAACHHDAAFSLITIGVAVPETAEPVADHARRLVGSMEPWAVPGVLPNFAPHADQTRRARAYDDPTRDRLLAVADRHDPDDVLVGHRRLRDSAALLGR
ncbi:MAG TPA: FAD-binding oxidoreductase [Segeticoccus sp.]|jgi:FAD/FMN-containing dehydrogenase|nr:FAD-binding oxidoreductase [Segeticoccus sp.]